jgi:regulatory protein RepA
LQASMSVAGADVDGCDLLGLKPTRSGQVIYLAGEDPVQALHHRLFSIGKHLPADARIAIAQNLTIESIVGRRMNVMDARHMKYLIEYCAGARLIVLDTLSRIHQLDENSNGDMAQLVSMLEYLSVQTGGTILFLHHVSKGSASLGQSDQQQAARGASALIDNARWCGFVSKLTADESEKLSGDRAGTPIGEQQRGYYVRVGTSKQNYGSPTEDRWYKRAEGGVLLPADMQPAKLGTKPKKGGDRDEA